MLKTYFISIGVFILSGCTAQPKSVILNPTYSAQAVSHFNTHINARVSDHRTTNFVIKVLNQEPAVYLPDASLPIKIERIFFDALRSNGATLDTTENKKVALQINTFYSKITESITQHESNATADFQIFASHNERTFEKRYTGTSQLKGPLKHEQAKVEGQLNNLTQKIITRIVSDQELINFLQGQ
ncbi:MULTISPECIES: YajG family lipoprotein [Pseudoalteromonas]|uniref:Lipoprotein n=1 Tax=Pseudoalteromonas aurantia 208 TaxID=1314867 RepID=A0ABR9EEZ0_9GAMM|nr:MULTISPECIES: YajG family lipoprotein [Pseudoalteromonas]MBE0369548.1 putative lipoprotein [Pseudoalteromonas aurantia 208]MBQ4844085.1 hypothetical protein [Pseudoalteromonas sp. MMG005]